MIAVFGQLLFSEIYFKICADKREKKLKVLQVKSA